MAEAMASEGGYTLDLSAIAGATTSVSLNISLYFVSDYVPDPEEHVQLIWNYSLDDEHTGSYIDPDSCSIYLLNEGGDRRAIVDEDNSYDVSGQHARYNLVTGQTYRLQIVPKKGYQLKSNMIDGNYTLEPVNSTDIGLFEFTAGTTDLCLDRIMEEVGTIVDITSDSMGKLWIDGYDDLSKFEPTPVEGQPAFDDTFGGSWMFTLMDKNDAPIVFDNTEGDLEGMIPEATFLTHFQQVMVKDGLDENTTKWVVTGSMVRKLGTPVTWRFVYPVTEGASYKVLAAKNADFTEYETIDPTIKNGCLEFSTDLLYKFTIVRNKQKTDGVVFDFSHVDSDEEEEIYKLTPTEGLTPVSAGSNKYKYTGAGNIKIKVEDKDGNPLDYEDIYGYDKDWINRLSAVFMCYEGEDEPHIFFMENRSGETIATVPAISDDRDHPYPIRDMLADALEHGGGSPTVTAYAWHNYEMPAKRVVFDAEGVTLSPEENINQAEVGEETHYYAYEGADYIVFKLIPDENTVITNVKYDVIDSIPDEDGNLDVVPRPEYPSDRAESLGGNLYKIYLPENYDHDWQARLGVSIEVETEQMTCLEIDFGDDSAGYVAKDYDYGYVEAFSVEERVGAQPYKHTPEFVTVEGNSTFKDYTVMVPRGENVAVKVVSRDGYNSVVNANLYLDPSKEDNTVIKPDKNGEFTFTAGSDKVRLKVNTAPVNKLVLTGIDDDEFEPYKGKYALGYDTVFNAFVSNGSRLNEEKDEIVPVKAEVTSFKNGKTAIAAGEGIVIEGNKLTTTGDRLGLAGKSLALNIESGGKTYSATISFDSKITKVSVNGADANKRITLPYGEDKNYKVTIDKGADPYSLRAFTATKNGENYVLDTGCKLGMGDGEELSIDSNNVVHNYTPDKVVYVVFCLTDDEGSPITDGEGHPVINKDWVFSVAFTNPLTGKQPVVKANAALSTHRAIGLSLALPKGVKATYCMYYMIDATAIKETYSTESGDDNLHRRDDESGSFVQVYKENIQEFVPADEKSAVISVVEDYGVDYEDGWPVEYEVNATLVYAYWDEQEVDDGVYEDVLVARAEGKSNPMDKDIVVSTKNLGYETKLALTKKTAKVYNGDDHVLVAVPKWSATTTVKSLDRVELLDKYGHNISGWDRWNGSRDGNYEIEVYNSDGGDIYIDTTREFEYRDEEGYLQTGTEYLEPGKYTIKAWAIGGPSVFPEATVSFTVVDGIRDLKIDAPATILKNYGKAANFNATVAYFGVDDRTPATKKVYWSVSRYSYVEEDHAYDLCEAENVKISNKGKVTIAKNFKISTDPMENVLVVRAQADDYYNNDVYDQREVKVVTTPQKPTKIYLRWYDDRTRRYNYSNVTEENIAAGEKFFSNNVNYAQIQVLDQYGKEMDAEIKVTNLDYNKEWNELRVKGPGTVSIKATARDGSKNYKLLKFNISLTDGEYIPNVVIQDAGREFINVDDPYEEMKGKEDNDLADGESIVNSYSSNVPIYIHVAGVREEHDDEGELQHINYGDNALIAHSVSVKGGKLGKVTYGEFDHYATYAIIPSASETIITVKDNTTDRRFPDRKKGTAHVYTVKNYGISDAKAFKITADKKSIYNRLWAATTLFDNDPTAVPNSVKYTITDAPSAAGKTYMVRLTMDNVNGGAHNIAEFMGLLDDRHDLNANGAYYPIENGAFRINFFQEREDDRGEKYYDFYTTPTGTYTFYATVGEAEVNVGGEVTKFTPLGKITAIKLKLIAPPKTTAKINNSKIKITSITGTPVDVATVSKGIGVMNYVSKDEATHGFIGDAYYTMSYNSKGAINGFFDLFEVINPAKKDGDNNFVQGAFILDADEKPILKPRDTFRPFPVDIAQSDEPAWIDNWEDLYLLSIGEYSPCIYDDNGLPTGRREGIIGTAANQKKAYTKWAKDNLTGYIGYRAVNYSGQEEQFSQKVTVDIKEFLKKYVTG